jgi:hypothetical protein
MLKHLNDNPYKTLLLSTLLLLFGQMFVPNSWGQYAKFILLFQHGLVGLILFFKSKYFRIFFSLFFVILTLALIADITEPKQYYIYFGIAYIIYFLVLTYKVFNKILLSKEVNHEMLSAVVCGFILLILMSSLVFTSIESIFPNSFTNLGTGVEKWNNLRYFSFISTLTIGFGDIVPINRLAKNATVILSLASHFYTVIVTGIFIGKYINKNVG